MKRKRQIIEMKYFHCVINASMEVGIPQRLLHFPSSANTQTCTTLNLYALEYQYEKTHAMIDATYARIIDIKGYISYI